MQNSNLGDRYLIELCAYTSAFRL